MKYEKVFLSVVQLAAPYSLSEVWCVLGLMCLGFDVSGIWGVWGLMCLGCEWHQIITFKTNIKPRPFFTLSDNDRSKLRTFKLKKNNNTWQYPWPLFLTKREKWNPKKEVECYKCIQRVQFFLELLVNRTINLNLKKVAWLGYSRYQIVWS